MCVTWRPGRFSFDLQRPILWLPSTPVLRGRRAGDEGANRSENTVYCGETVTPESPLPEEIVQLLSLGFAVVYEPESLSLRVTDFDRSTERGFCFIENRHAPAGQLYVSPGRALVVIHKSEFLYGEAV